VLAAGVHSRFDKRMFSPISTLQSPSHYRWLAPALAGVLLALAFPCHPQHPLHFLFNAAWAYVALIPLLTRLNDGGFKEGFKVGWIAGACFNLIGLYWVAYTQGGGPAVIGGTVLMAVYLGLYTGLFAGSYQLLARRWGNGAVLTTPVLWTAQEYLLSLGELGFPWMLLGHSQAGFPHLIQYAAFTGVYGVTFWVVLVNAVLYLLLNAAPQLRPRLVAASALFLCFALPWSYGAAVIAAADTNESNVRVALIQPNLTLAEKWGSGGLERSFTALETLSRQAAKHNPQLLVWPETALPCYLQLRPDCQNLVRRLVDELQVPLLTGASDYNFERSEPYNSAFLFYPQQDAVQTYAKMHLVPFGERTPFRDDIPLLRDIDWTVLTGDLGPAEFAPGTEHTIFAHPQAPFAVSICFESVFPDLVRRSVRQGARLLVNITNDSWFGRTAGPYQHAQLAILRAVENRTAIARCANTGISLFIDPYGRTSQATDLFAPAFRVGDLAVNSHTTFYTRHGDLFAQGLLAAACVLLLVARLAKSRAV